MEKAVAILNDLIPIFNKDDQNYKDLIADKTKSSINPTGPTTDLTPYGPSDFPDIDDALDSGGNFVPVQSSNGVAVVRVGNYEWQITDVPGVNKNMVGQDVGTLAGSVSIRPPTGKTWAAFAASSNNGPRSIVIPPLGIGHMRIGSTFIVR